MKNYFSRELLSILVVLGLSSSLIMGNTPQKQKQQLPPCTPPTEARPRLPLYTPPTEARPTECLTNDDDKVNNDLHTPTDQGANNFLKLYITPEMRRYQVVKLAQDQSTIHVADNVREQLERLMRLDQSEEYEGRRWWQKDQSLRSLFTIHGRVQDAFAPMLRERVCAQRNQENSIECTPDKGASDHTLTIGHMIAILLNGAAYLSLPDDCGGLPRLTIISRIEQIEYSEAIQHPDRLQGAQWATLCFAYDPKGWKCMHYFASADHPQDIRFGNGRWRTYHLLPISLSIGLSSSLMFFINPDEFNYATCELKQQQQQQQQQQALYMRCLQQAMVDMQEQQRAIQQNRPANGGFRAHACN